LEADELTANDMPRLARPTTGEIIDVKKNQMDFFQQQEHTLRDELKEIDINKLTPLDALNKLFELKKIVEDKN